MHENEMIKLLEKMRDDRQRDWEAQDRALERMIKRIEMEQEQEKPERESRDKTTEILRTDFKNWYTNEYGGTK